MKKNKKVTFSEDAKSDCDKRRPVRMHRCDCYGCKSCNLSGLFCVNFTKTKCTECNKNICNNCINDKTICMYCEYLD